MQAAFDKLCDDIWSYSEEIFNDALRCNVGKEPCETVTKYNLIEVPVTDADLKLVGEAVMNISYPAWSKVCDQSLPGCSQKWKEILGPIVGAK